MSNVVRAIRTRVLLDNLATGDERWASLIGCQMIHPLYGLGTIREVRAERFRDAIFGVEWASGKSSDVSTASFINGKVTRVIVPDTIGIPPQLSKWVHNEESDGFRKERLAIEAADKSPRRRTARSSKTSAA
jgi:hypothetical protein